MNGVGHGWGRYEKQVAIKKEGMWKEKRRLHAVRAVIELSMP